MHRPSRPLPLRRHAGRERFAHHPIGLAALLALAGPALALPQGATVVSGEVTVQQPSSTLQVVTQGSASAIVDWRSFSIGAGETVRFNQPNASSVVLNRVVGYDPSSILGRLQANGQVFLLNPQGVVFGAGARVDVGGLVASTLSMSNTDFAAGRYRLTAQPGARLGEVRNDGSLRAPGGSVVLAGPNVTNTGVIEADGGRVAMAAANSVLVDVEGDGLVLFEAPGDEAGNRLAQLGRIQADGGSVELRALARRSFTDTVINMDGVVQARGLGLRDGKVVIDGGALGTTVIAGTVDASGSAPGQHGGDVAVTGQRVLLGATAVVDASGSAGGGRIRIGGGWQGNDASVRNADRTTVTAGALLDASARDGGAGGEAVVWSDRGTRFDGSVRATGGAAGGDGGRVEISGRDGLAFAGRADVSAAAGRAGNVLFDPTNITVATAGTAAPGDVDQFADPGAALVIAPSALENVQGSVTLQATRDITVTDAIALSTAGASFTARAGNNIAVNNAITTTGGAITLTANDAGGPASGTGQVTIAGNLSGSSITVNGPAQVTGSRTITGTGAVRFGNDIVGGGGDLTLNGTGTKSLNTVGGLATITTAGGTTTLNGDVSTTTAQDWGDVVTSGPVTLTTPQLTTNGVLNAGANDLALQVDGVSIGNGIPTGTGGFRLAPFSAASSISVASNVPAAANYASGVLNFFLSQGFTSLTVGRADGSGTMNVGTGNTLNLAVPTTFLSGTGSITLGGTIVGNGNPITVNTAGATTLGATLVNVPSFSNTGTTIITADVTTTGAQQYGTAQLGANVTLTGSGITFGSLNAANRNLALQTDGFAFATTPTNLAAVTLSGSTAATSIGVDAGGGTLSLTNARLGLFSGASSLTIGRATGTGAITVASAGPTYTLTRDLAFQSANAAIRFDDAVQGARALTVTNGGTTTTTGALTGLTSVTVNGTGTTVLGGNVSTTAAQRYGAVSLAAGATLSGTQLTLGPVTGNTNALTVTASVGTSIASATGLASLTANGAGPTTLGGNVATSGGQSYGAVTLGADAVLAGGTLALGAVIGGGNDLTLTAAGGASIGSASGLTTLTANGAGATTLNGNVTTSGAQSFGAVALGADAGLTGSTLALGNVAGNGNDLTLTAATGASIGSASGLTTLTANGAGPTTLNGNVTTGGAQRYGSVILGADAALAGNALTLGAVTGGGNDLTLIAVNGASVGSAGGLATLTANGAGATTLNGSVTTTGAQRYGAVALGADTTLTGSDINVGGAVSGGANSLTVAPSATASLARIDAGAFTTTGAGTTTLGGDVTTTGDQTYSSNVQLGAPAVLTAPQLNFLGNFDAGPNDLALQFAGGAFGGSLTGSGQLRLAGSVAAQSIGIGSAVPADLNLSQVAVNQLFSGGFGTLAFGRPDGTGAITIGSFALPADTTLVGASAPVSFGSGLAGNGRSLNVASGGATTIDGSVAGLASLTVAGPASLNGSITSTGAQRFDGGLTLGGPATLTGTQLAFGSATPLARGANVLVMNTRDLVLASASTGTGPVTLGAFTAGESVSYAAALPSTSAYAADEIGRFASTSALTLGRADGSGAITVGAFTLPADTTIAGSAATVDLQGAINGAGHALAVTPSGATTLAAAPTGLDSLSIAGPATLPGGTISTSGDQRYARDVALSSDLTLDAANLDFGGALALGTHALTLQFDGALGGPLSASGSGVFSLAPRNAASTIGVAGGAGTFQVTQATLDGLAGLPNLGVGRADGTGTVTVGAVTLPANLQLRSGSGNVALTSGASGQTHDLGVSTGGTTSLAGAFTGLGALDIAGPTSLAGATTVAADTVRFGATLDGAQTLTLNAGQASVAGAVGGAAPLSGLTVNAPLALDGGQVATTGAQVYRGAVTLGAATTLAAGSVDFTSTVDGAQALTIDSAGITRFGSAVGGNTALTRITTDGPGTTLLAADVTTTGAQSYGDAAQLAAPVTLSGGRVGFGSTVDGAQALTVNAAQANLAGAVGGVAPLASLKVNAPLALDGGRVTTTGAQEYRGAITLGAATTLNGSGIDFASTVDGTQSLTVDSAGITRFGTAIGATAALASLTTDAAGSTTLAGNITTLGAQTFGDALTLAAPVALQASRVSLDGTVDGDQALTVDAADTTLVAAVGSTTPLAGLSITGGTATLPASVTTTGAQSYAAVVRLPGATTLQASAIDFARGLQAGAGDVVTRSDNLALGGAATGSGQWFVEPMAAGTSIGLGSGAGTLQLDNAFLGALNGFARLTIGRADGSAAIRGDSLVLSVPTTVQGAGASLELAGTTDGGGQALDVRVGGLTTVSGTAGGLSSVNIAGPARLDGGRVASTGAQTWQGPLEVLGTSSLDAGTLALQGEVDGTGALAITSTVGSSFATTVGANAPLASLSVDGPVQLSGGSVRTTGAQRFGGAVALAADTTLTGTDIALQAGADGAHALAVQSSGTATLGGAFGAAAPLASLDIAGSTRLAADITTLGAQRYAGAVALDGATRLTGGTIDLSGTVDGAQALTLASAGPVHVGGNIGDSTALASLDVQSGAPVRLDGSLVATTAAQRYGTAVQLAPGARLSAGTLDFGGAVQAGRDLVLEADALQAAGAVTGSGTLTIAPRTAGVAVGVAGGAGALQVTQAVIDGASGFVQHVIGRADATAPLDVGALTLKADTTLRAGQADLAVRGGIDGPFELQLQSGGTTLITASLGATQALRSLTTDNQAGASDWNGSSGEHVRFDGAAVSVVTTGAQNYRDPVVGRVPLTLVADTLNAVQAGNRFDGPITGQLGEVQLSTGGSLDLGDLRIARGGTIDAGGALGLHGALQLGGGTLTLRSAAQPAGGGFQDAALAGRTLQIGGARLQEAGAAIGQSVGSTVSTATGSQLVALAPGGGSVLIDRDGNTLLGTVSAISGTPGDSGDGRLGSGATNSVGFVRLRSSELHLDAVEADAVLLSADRIDQSAGSVVRARIPLVAGQSLASALPGLTLVPGPVALATEGSFGSAGSGLRVQVGDTGGGLVTARPLPAPAPSSTVYLNAGGAPLTYVLAGQPDAVRVVIDGGFVLTAREQAARRLTTASTSAPPTLPGFAPAAGAAPGDDAAEAQAGTTRPPEECRPLPGTLKCE